MIAQVRRFLESVEKAALIVLLTLMIALAFAQVCLRAFFSTGFLWADVFLRHLVLWVGFLGAVLAVSGDKHFAMDVLRKYFPRKFQRAMEILSDLFSLAVLALLSQSALHFYKDDAQSGSILFTIRSFDVPSAWMNAVIPGVFILLWIHFALKLAEDLVNPARGLDAAGRPELPREGHP